MVTDQKEVSDKCYIKDMVMVRVLSIMKDTQLQAQWPLMMLETCYSDEYDVSGGGYAHSSLLHE